MAIEKKRDELAEHGKVCPSCGKSATETAKFCAECGCALGDIFCSECGAKIEATDRFCGQCGKKIR